jgi:hypothetical protein
MADPFTPRFVDLVRNYSTTAGTADFVLSASVNTHLVFRGIDRLPHSAHRPMAAQARET